MKLAHTVAHIFFPRQSNNHKPKLLQNSGLSVLTVLLILFQLTITFAPKAGLKMLGYAANISPEEVVRLTNEKRTANGLAPLTMNQTLVSAALAKGTDMINKDYWAHVSPDGTQPWSFFTNASYSYRYAGENLARDFSNPSSAVDAWMASPSHKDNIMSSKYKEVGVAVVEGDLAGVDTTIIVQLFGAQYVDITPAVPIAFAQPASESTMPPSPSPTQPPAVSGITPLPENVSAGPGLISPFNTTKSISITTVGMLFGVLVIDGIAISRKKINRVGGRTFAHLAFLGMIFTIALVLKAGQIL